jgi:hypothetical protein
MDVARMRRCFIAAALLIAPTICSASQVSFVSDPKTIAPKERADVKPRPAAGTTTGAALPATPEDVVVEPVVAEAAQDDDKPASPEEVCSTLAAAAQAHDLPTPFFIRLIWQESRFKPDAVSPVGAQGVAQFMPKTASAMGLENPFDPIAALPVSAQLLRDLHNQFGNLGLAAAAYNAGPKRVIDWLTKRGPLPKETRDYVQIITGRPAEEWRGTNPVVKINVSVPQRAPCRSGDAHAEVHASVPGVLNPSIADDIPPDPPKATKVAAKKGKKDKKATRVAAKQAKGRKGKVVVAEISAARANKKAVKKADKKSVKRATSAKSAAKQATSRKVASKRSTSRKVAAKRSKVGAIAAKRSKTRTAAAKTSKSARPMHLASVGKTRQ